MSKVQFTVPRPLVEPDHIAIHPLIDLRIPETARPLIETNCGDVVDAGPRLSTLFPWRRLERLTIATCQSESSKCYSAGGLRSTSGDPLTVGSIPLNRDGKARLNSSAREALSHLGQTAIENITLTKIDGSHHHDKAIASIEIDPANVDREAHVTTVDCDMATRQPARQTCTSQKARIIAEPTHFPARLQGHDASHRTRNLDTHLTHGCIQQFCGFGGMLIASRQMARRENGAVRPFHAMANSISPGAVR